MFKTNPGSGPVRPPTSRAEWDANLLATADYFTATRFEGQGQYTTIKAKTLELARACAKVLDTGKGAMIYAVKGNFSCHVENYPVTVGYPSRKK